MKIELTKGECESLVDFIEVHQQKYRRIRRTADADD